jgi:hypothetical protein
LEVFDSKPGEVVASQHVPLAQQDRAG